MADEAGDARSSQMIDIAEVPHEQELAVWLHGNTGHTAGNAAAGTELRVDVTLRPQ